MQISSPARILLLLVLAVLASGCGVQFVYNKLDWLIPWYVDDYVSLSEQQEFLLDKRLQPYLAQHRREQLPRYAEFLERIADAAEDGLDETEVEALLERTQQLGNELFASIAPSFHEIFAGLSDAQVDQIRHNLAQKNLELEERYIEMEEARQRELRNEEMRGFLERWLGELEEDQVAMVEEWSQKFLLMGPEFMHSRRVWQARLFEVLERRKDRQYFEPALVELFGNRYLGRTEQHQRKFEVNEKLLRGLYQRLDESLSSFQRHLMLDELRDYASDFHELSQQ